MRLDKRIILLHFVSLKRHRHQGQPFAEDILKPAAHNSCTMGILVQVATYEELKIQMKRPYQKRRAVACLCAAKLSAFTIRSLSPILAVLLLLLLILLQHPSATHADRGIDGRHSYSLTTFDPSGKLGQVERALQAAQHGTPVVALVTADRQAVLLAAPQALPTSSSSSATAAASESLVLDDGTARFVPVTSEIMVAHSGLAADGRILTAAAQRLAVEHEYTFDEPRIDIAIFLEEMALLMQRYTTLPSARPFGASILVAFVPETDLCLRPEPQLYLLDPSGNVDTLQTEVPLVIHGGNLERGTRLREELQEIIRNQKKNNDNEETSCSSSAAYLEDDRARVVTALQQALRQQAAKNHPARRPPGDQPQVGGGDQQQHNDMTILTASLRRDAKKGGVVFCTKRHEPDR